MIQFFKMCTTFYLLPKTLALRHAQEAGTRRESRQLGGGILPRKRPQEERSTRPQESDFKFEKYPPHLQAMTVTFPDATESCLALAKQATTSWRQEVCRDAPCCALKR